MRPLLRAAVAALAAWMAVGTALAGPVLERVVASGIMTMASDPDFPPQSFLNDDQEMVGFDVSVGRELARRLGVELRIVTPSRKALTAGNWGDDWDVSVGSMTPTSERMQVLDFPAVYYWAPAVFAVPAGSSIEDPHSLAGKIIGVCEGCTYQAYLEGKVAFDPAFGPRPAYRLARPDIRTFPGDRQALAALGRPLDAVMGTLPALEQAIREGHALRILSPPAFLEPLAIAIDKGDPLFAARLADLVRGMRRDGTLAQLSQQWLGADLTQHP